MPTYGTLQHELFTRGVLLLSCMTFQKYFRYNTDNMLIDLHAVYVRMNLIYFIHICPNLTTVGKIYFHISTYFPEIMKSQWALASLKKRFVSC